MCIRDRCGDASKARRELGWSPTTSFAHIVRRMLEADLAERGLDASVVIELPLVADPA